MLGDRIIGWFQGEAEPVNWVEDRFSSFYAYEHWEAPVSSEETFAQTNLEEFNLRDITRLGFTTREYQAMVRFWTACNGNDWLRSESELDIMIGWAEERRLHLNDNELIDFIINRRYQTNTDEIQNSAARARRQDIKDDHSYWGIWNVPLWRVHFDEMREYEAALYMEVATDLTDWVRSWDELRVVMYAGGHMQSNGRAEELFRARADSQDVECSEYEGYSSNDYPTSSLRLHPSPITTNGGSLTMYDDYSWC